MNIVWVWDGLAQSNEYLTLLSVAFHRIIPIMSYNMYSHGDDEDGLYYRVEADVHEVHDKDVRRIVA